MAMRSVTAKLGTMRKAQDFTVYPAQADSTTVILQSGTRIAEFDPVTGAGMLSKACSGGAYFLHLTKFMGAVPVVVPKDVIDAVIAARPKSGDAIGPGVYVG